MAKKRGKVKCLLISSQKGIDYYQPILKDIISEISGDIQLDFYTQAERNIISRSRQSEKNILNTVVSNDLIFVDIRNIPIFSLFDIGVIRAIGKPIIFIGEGLFLDDLPDIMRQSFFISYRTEDDLRKRLKMFLGEYLENPKRFTPRSLIDLDSNSQIVVDLDKLGQRDFENLCFELLSRLGYKQLEWIIKDDIIDAITSLRKRDPDGFEYNEYWIVSFSKEFASAPILDLAVHDPEFFADRVFRRLSETNLIKNRITETGRDVPFTLLFILRGKENYEKQLIKGISSRELRISRKGLFPSTIRFRIWDDQTITNLVQSNLPLARRYFSSDALTRSGVRLSYEDLYKQYAIMNSELEKVLQQLKIERNKVEILERDAAWKLLSFTAAHRLGNPIDAIDSELTNLRSALTLGKTEIIPSIIDSMELPVERAKSIVSQFRNLSIAHEIKPEIVDNKKLDEILNNALKKATDKKIDVKLNFSKVPDISLDQHKFSECCEELVRNALHFVKENDPHISVETSIAKDSELPDKLDKTKKYIKINFADNGCGVPIGKKKIIFKPFERSYIHGTGLGLAFCEIIIEKHGGIIRETGKENEGANFEIFLPIVSEKQNK